MFRWTRKRSRCAPPSVQEPRSRRIRPQLEALEERYAPALMVTSALDNGGAGTLRTVIANTPANSTIEFSISNAVITLTQGEIPIKVSGLTITGLNQGNNQNISIGGNNSSRIFDISGANLSETLSYLTFMNGDAPAIPSRISAKAVPSTIKVL